MMCLLRMTTMIWLAAASLTLGAQVAKGPSFDVVSVKPNNSGSGDTRVMLRDDGLTMQNCTLLTLVSFAYDMRPTLMSGGPPWGSTARYDVTTKVAEADLAEAKKSDVLLRMMLRTALAERFELQVHNEVKILPVYELVVAKGGPKMKQATPGDTYANGMKTMDGVGRAGMFSMGRGELTGPGVAMGKVADLLYGPVQRKVLDKTGLTGTFDFTLTWSSETPAGMGTADTETKPGIFTALQEQLGLRLQAAKGQVDTLAIDHAEKPAEN